MKNYKILLIGSEGLIGSSFKKYLLSKNHNLFCVDIKKNKKELTDKNFFFLKCNINSPQALKKIISAACQKLGNISHVIDCSYPQMFMHKTINSDTYNFKTLKKNIGENISKNIITCEILSKYFIKNKISGNVILMNSIQGIMAPKFEHYRGTNMSSPIEYTALKFSLSGIIKYFAKAYGKYSINFNCISPGGIKNKQPKMFLKKYKKSCLTKGMLDANDLNTTLEFLINAKSRMVNGQNIIVDDGWTL